MIGPAQCHPAENDTENRIMTGVTIGYFLLGYVIVWAVEVSRLFFRLSWQFSVLVGLAIATILTHGLFVYNRMRLAQEQLGHWTIPATFFDWSQIAAFGLALVYVLLTMRRPKGIFGIFLLPIVILFILVSMSLRDGQPFQRDGSLATWWGYIHGGGLSLATVSVSLGLVVAIMRLWQQRRLKSKRGVGGPLRLPSLEYLDSMGRSCLIASTACIAVGLIGGFIMNAFGRQSVPWLEPGILISGGLLLWMLIALTIEVKTSRRGGSNAVTLNVVTFALTAVAICTVFLNAHGRPPKPDASIQAISKRDHAERQVAS